MLLRPLLPLARRALGADHEITLRLAHAYVCVVLVSAAGSRDDGIFAEKLLEDTVARMRRVFGNEHPYTRKAEGDLAKARRRLAQL